MKTQFLFLLIFLTGSALAAQTFSPRDPGFSYQGRIDFSDPEAPRLSSSASGVRFRFEGKKVEVHLQDQFQNGSDFNYLAVELDGVYQGRFPTEKGKTVYLLADDLAAGSHTLVLAKATEAQNGWVEFRGVTCDRLLSPPAEPKRKIELIGNSITCGMGVETADIPCGSANWFDQHNAFLAYGPVLARRLDAGVLLSSVSGIGVYRNWNSDGPVMPEVYGNLYLDGNASKKWDSGRFQADLVTVCLGTNDFSDGDGKTARAPLDSSRFVSAYIRFLKTLRETHPGSRILLLSSPMVNGDRSRQLVRWLEVILSERQKSGESSLFLFTWSTGYSGGCTTHPDRDDHRRMADELEPVIRSIMGW
ncbi:MAG: GDSL-type esterase/lipase family protein [Bacteroidetes bacterium]|nr:GDSL-type esterase/lipase family protein [Bacteroidota bacterium]